MDERFTPLLQKIEQSIDSFLPRAANPAWARLSFACDCPAEGEARLITPVRALVDLGGKRWRPLLSVLCARAASGGEAEELSLKLCPLIEAVHTASLIHDDIEDRSTVRRGAPAAYVTYGLDTAVNAASWLYFQAAVCIQAASCSAETKNRLYDAYLTETRRMHLGQALDIAWHTECAETGSGNGNSERAEARSGDGCSGGRTPSAEEYLFMTGCKTGSLAALAAAVGILCAARDDALVRRAEDIARNIGAGFQIIDDVINLTTGNPGKRRGDDIVEGKKSLIVIDFMKSAEGNPAVTNELLACLKDAARDGIESPSVEKAIGLLEDSHSIDRAAKKGLDLIQSGADSFVSLFGKDNEDALLIKDLFVSMIPGTVRSM